MVIDKDAKPINEALLSLGLHVHTHFPSDEALEDDDH